MIDASAITLACDWGGHVACQDEAGCGCACHDLLVLGHHPQCDGECRECPVLVERSE